MADALNLKKCFNFNYYKLAFRFCVSYVRCQASNPVLIYLAVWELCKIIQLI